jgi:hypothetical protein
MNKAAGSALLVLFVVAVYVALPAVIIWGWVRWSRSTQPRTVPSILSLIGFTLATGRVARALNDFELRGAPSFVV